MNIQKYLFAGSVILGLSLPVVSALAAPIGISTCQIIATSGSYLLTNNLNAVGDCLIVAVDHVTIDLDGYVMAGNGTGAGIKGSGGVRKNITVRNGTIRNFANGVSFFFDGMLIAVERMRLIDNSSFGAAANELSSVKDSMVTGSSIGIGLGSRSMATGNIARGNNDGFNISSGSLVTGNTAGANTRDGFQVGNGSTISNNASHANTRYGFTVDCGSSIQSNTATLNGTNLKLNTTLGACAQGHNLAP